MRCANGILNRLLCLATPLVRKPGYADQVTLNAYDASAAGAVLRLIEEMGATLRRGGEARRRDRDDPQVAQERQQNEWDRAGDRNG